MKTRIFNTTLIAALLAATGTAQAAHPQSDNDDDSFIARAQVLSSTPVYDTVNDPRRECWTETSGYETRSYRDGRVSDHPVRSFPAGDARNRSHSLVVFHVRLHVWHHDGRSCGVRACPGGFRQVGHAWPR